MRFIRTPQDSPHWVTIYVTGTVRGVHVRYQRTYRLHAPVVLYDDTPHSDWQRLLAGALRSAKLDAGLSSCVASRLLRADPHDWSDSVEAATAEAMEWKDSIRAA